MDYTKMKLFLMTDLEGVSGVLNVDDWIYPASKYYNVGKKLLTEEANSAIVGFSEAGFKKIVVNDAHGCGAIDIELLNKHANLMRGWSCKDGPYTHWPFGLDSSYDALGFIGQHAKSGTEFSHLTHTGSFKYLDITINGISVGEYGQMVLAAGELGIPVIFAAGERALQSEVFGLTPWVVFTWGKEGTIGGTGETLQAEKYEHFHEGALHMHPLQVRESIYNNAKKAGELFFSSRKKFTPLLLDKPYKLICKLRRTSAKPAKVIELKGNKIAPLLNQMIKNVEKYYGS